MTPPPADPGGARLSTFLIGLGVPQDELDEPTRDYVLALAADEDVEADVISEVLLSHLQLDDGEDWGCRVESFVNSVRSGGGIVGAPPNTDHEETAARVGQRAIACALAADMGDSSETQDEGFLREVMPQIPSEVIRYVLLAQRLSRKAAVDFLLEETSSTQRLETLTRKAEAWAGEKREREDEEAREKRELKAGIVEKFADQVIRPQADSSAAAGKGGKKKEGGILVAYPDKKGASGLRYRDGRVAATKGEKFIVENLKPEWDGGSRGRVKSKGKRGKGWTDG